MTRRWLLAVLCGLTGCAINPTPYRFGSPLIGGVTARIEAPAPTDEPDQGDAPDRRPPPDHAATPARKRARVAAIDREDVVTGSGADPLPPEEPGAPPPPRPNVSLAGSGLVLSKLASPHRADGPIAIGRPATVVLADLRALTGTRVTDDPVAFAIALAATTTHARHPPDPVPTDGEALAAWASKDARTVDAAEARAGDLMVFDRALGDRPASVWAVVIARDAGGVVEVLYVGAGVIRRGFVDPAQPHVARDKQRVVHNTYMRHGKDWPPKGTRFLTGELLTHVYRLR